ncbi:MAG: ATP-binding cassette domain-containing protein [Methanothrix sp.]|nr:ATP-binding cassette domain-containing protein [Methanothrix sp.]MCX8206764.1 ATP-binding cassette domain-containing protein [Methanothrix sp.]
MEHAIETRGLVKRFDGLVAVDDVNLSVKRGEIFGLLGPNGAGKSTIIKMLTTMLRPSAGEAYVWGHHIVRERDAVRSCIGVVFQDPSVDGKLTARENLDFHGRMYGMPGAERKRRIAEVLELVELSDKADVLLEDFSGGMRRRLEIARGLMHRPHVLFLDEPTLGLDTQTRRYIWDYIRAMNREEDVTVVITTHYMEEADNLCNRVAIIDHGRIVALDSPTALKSMIGTDTLTLEVKDGMERLRDVLLGFEWVRSFDASNGYVNLSVDSAQSRIPEVVLAACRAGVRIRSVSVHEPTLEDVFLRYTGRSMRDETVKGDLVRALMRR